MEQHTAKLNVNGVFINATHFVEMKDDDKIVKALIADHIVEDEATARFLVPKLKEAYESKRKQDEEDQKTEDENRRKLEAQNPVQTETPLIPAGTFEITQDAAARIYHANVQHDDNVTL